MVIVGTIVNNMPELPEVTTVTKILTQEVRDKVIQDVFIYREKNILNEPSLFINSLKRKTIKTISRKGKYIIFHLSDNVVLITHLKMEGKFFYDEKPLKRKHDIVTFLFTDSTSLSYVDTRKFGILKVSTEDKYLKEPPLNNVGPDPLEIDNDYLIDKYKNLKKPIKEVLLDQSLVSGIGNIYADEILFASKIHPLTLASSLSEVNFIDILNNAKKILNQAILDGGTTVKSYHPKEGIDGAFQTKLKVYNKEGLPCPNCHTSLRKIKVNGRGTTYCPRCQTRKEHRIIAITGAIASGKSTVSSYLKNKGYLVIDADEITHNLYKNSEFLKKLKLIVPQLEIANSHVNRKQLLGIINSNILIKTKIENLVFINVKKIIKKTIYKNKKANIVLDVPLLFASNIDELADEIYIIRTPLDKQKEHLANRNVDITKYLKLNESYYKQEKENKATVIIENNSDLKSLYKKIDEIICREKFR